MSEESDEDPFAGTRTDSDFQLSNNENIVEEPKNTESEIPRGKWRVRKESLWKRNERKAKKLLVRNT